MEGEAITWTLVEKTFCRDEDERMEIILDEDVPEKLEVLEDDPDEGSPIRYRRYTPPIINLDVPVVTISDSEDDFSDDEFELASTLAPPSPAPTSLSPAPPSPSPEPPSPSEAPPSPSPEPPSLSPAPPSPSPEPPSPSEALPSPSPEPPSPSPEPPSRSPAPPSLSPAPPSLLPRPVSWGGTRDPQVQGPGVRGARPVLPRTYPGPTKRGPESPVGTRARELDVTGLLPPSPPYLPPSPTSLPPSPLSLPPASLQNCRLELPRLRYRIKYIRNDAVMERMDLEEDAQETGCSVTHESRITNKVRHRINKGPFKCPYCPKRFKEKNYMLAHFRRNRKCHLKYSINENRQNSSKETRSSNGAVMEHEHSSKRPAAETQANVPAPPSQDKETDEMEEDPVAPPKNGLSVSSSSRMYYCELCPKFFERIEWLSQHLIENHVCPSCNRFFARVKTHRCKKTTMAKKGTSGQRFWCHHCGNNFKTKLGIIAHLKRWHL